MQFKRILYIWFLASLVCAGMSQAKSGINGRTYRNDNIGLTYAIPQGLAADPKMQIPQDPAGREFIILALWDNPRHTPIPRITFLYETKEAPAGLSAEEIALRYLHSLERNRDGYKMSEPKKLLSAGFAMWRMDYWRPDDAGQSYNSAIIVPLKDRRLLFIQMNAASQNELDSLVGSLNNLQLDKR